jgi:hypothetical protein
MVSTALAKGDILGAVGINKSSFGLGLVGSVFLWILIGIVFLGAVGAVVVWIYLKKSYNQKAWVFGRVGGVPTFKQVYPARYVKFGAVGDRLFEISKLKKFIAPPTIQMGKNIWWFWEREDGELINVGLKDIDAEMKKVGAYFMETDVRMQRLGIEKNLRDRLEEKGFWAKYASTIAGVIFVILVTVCLVVLFSKLVDVAKSIDTLAGSVSSMATEIQAFYKARAGGLSPSDIGRNGTSGLVPALIPVVFSFYKLRRRE